jgi:23S rRNA-/tRNA-specific pseudouridylate synthase
VRKVPNEARAEVVDARHGEGRLAILHYRVRAQLSQNTALEIELETGRTHQIRVQAGTHGHPLLGDILYGSTAMFGPQTTDVRERRIALLARSLEFRHPKTREPMRFEAPLPAEWQGLGLPDVES